MWEESQQSVSLLHPQMAASALLQRMLPRIHPSCAAASRLSLLGNASHEGHVHLLQRETQTENKKKSGGYWAEIQLDRPERRNALTGGMMASLGACVYSLALATTVSENEEEEEGRRMEGIVLRGSGGFFCSGSDLTLLTLSSMDDASTMVDYMQVRVKARDRCYRGRRKRR